MVRFVEIMSPAHAAGLICYGVGFFCETGKDAEMEARLCRVCQSEIPRARLEAIPETLICVQCSEKTGGEFELEVTISGISKAGSLKKTGESVSARRKRKPVQ